jgi:hypothetical protein
MPTFPQHRNMKKVIPKEAREQEPAVADQTNNLPAISDLVSYKLIRETYVTFFICFYLTYALQCVFT